MLLVAARRAALRAAAIRNARHARTARLSAAAAGRRRAAHIWCTDSARGSARRKRAQNAICRVICACAKRAPIAIIIYDICYYRCHLPAFIHADLFRFDAMPLRRLITPFH
jgi:hypothetical protein